MTNYVSKEVLVSEISELIALLNREIGSDVFHMWDDDMIANASISDLVAFRKRIESSARTIAALRQR